MAATANIKAGKAYVEVTAETSRFRKNLAGAQAELRAFGKTCTALGRDMLAFGGALSLPFALAEKSFAGFDDRMRLVQAYPPNAARREPRSGGYRGVTNATGEAFDSLTKT